MGLLAASAALVVAFVVIELRSKAPLLPMRIFRLRTLAASNISGVLLAGAVFSQFFLLTLYMQQVLHYSALKTGVAYVALTLSIIAFSGLAQALANRIGVRPVLTAGLVLSAGGLVLYAQLPVHGQYFWDLFPAYLLSGVGMAFTFVPMTIAGLTGVAGADAGIASGLINTSRQIGGAVGLAAVSTIAAASTSHGVATSLAGAELTHGFRTAFDVLTVLALLGAAVAVRFVAPPKPAVLEPTFETDIIEPMEEAA